MDSILRTQKICTDYTDRGHCVQVLDQLDLTIRRGEFYAIVGPSGCGKTTLLHVLAGLKVPSSGVVTRHGKIAMVFQKPQLLPWRTVLDNTLFGIECRRRVTTEDRARAVALLAQMQLSDHLQAFPYQLSEGMKQRVNLARALLVEPDILLMDEPFSALDLILRRHLHDDLLALWEARGFTVVLVSHALDEVAYLCDRVAIFTQKPMTQFECVTIELPRPRRAGADATYQWLHVTADLEARLELSATLAH